MELYFNELSLNADQGVSFEDVSRLGKLYLQLKKQHITTCRIGDKDYRTFIEMASKLQGYQRNIAGFLFSFLRRPYESSDVDENQELYYEHNWLLNEQQCYGLALAYIMESMSVSIGEERWNNPFISIRCDEDFRDVRNLFGNDTLSFHLSWLEENKCVELAESIYLPEEKTIKLRNDHGYNELLTFGNLLLKNKYVDAVINSMPFNPRNRRFIHDVKSDGIVEIVLPWSDQGLGIVVQTTGRNLRETQEIAKILKEKYNLQ